MSGAGSRRRRRLDPTDLTAIQPGVRKDGTVVYKPYVYDPSRKSKKRWLGPFVDLREAQDARDRARLERRPGRGMLLAAFVELFLASDGWSEEGWASGTRARYRSALRPLVEQYGDRYCDDVTPLEASVWGSTQPLGVTDTARTMYNAAVRNEVATANPFANLRRKRSRGRSDILTLSEAEVLALAGCALPIWGEFGAVVRAKILFAAYSGMRAAELWALRWSDVRFASGEIRVEWQFTQMGEAKIKAARSDARRRGTELLVVPGGVLTRPKNRKAKTIVLLDEAAAALRSFPRRLGSDYVFATQSGALFSKSGWHYYWDPVRAAFTGSLPDGHWLPERVTAGNRDGDFDFHELRHLCATLMVDAGIAAEDVAEQLGHLDGGKLVRKLYGHPSKELARERIRAGMRQRGPGRQPRSSPAHRRTNRP